VRHDAADPKPLSRNRQHLGLSAFGLGLLTDTPPPGAWEPQPIAEPLLRLRPVPAAAITQTWSGLETIGWEGTIDGARFVVERGRAGDHRFVHGANPDQDGPKRSEYANETQAVHHLSSGGGLLQCAPSNSNDPSWWRVVLDSVLFTVALLQGYEALHAGAVATPNGALAITATSGGGKSTLLLELMRHDLALVADDVLVLESRASGAPVAYPAPPLMTIPAARLRAAPTKPPLSSICSVEDEHWIAVPVYPEPLPLAALVVLNRRSGLATTLRRVHMPLAVLMSSFLRFPRTREREVTRFELASALATHVPIWELDADPSVAPAVLADLLMAALATPASTPTPSFSTAL
jgi:hypothetical protein